MWMHAITRKEPLVVIVGENVTISLHEQRMGQWGGELKL